MTQFAKLGIRNMEHAIALIALLKDYWVFSIGTAAGVYGGIVFLGKHASDGFKDDLKLWLWGEYKHNWAALFCRAFDGMFGAAHLSFKCFKRSAAWSILYVVFLYWLMGPILGLLERHEESPDFYNALLLGIALNILPDYLSLFETRWLLGRFKHVKSITVHFALLLLDVLLSLAIIVVAINIYALFQGEGEFIGPIQLGAIFSEYSIFFYSTFLTSLMAWLYVASTGLMRLFLALKLNYLLNVDKTPIRTLALFCGGLVLFASFVYKQLPQSNHADDVSQLDMWLCDTFPKRCADVVRLTEGEKLRQQLFETECLKGITFKCNDLATKQRYINPQKAAILYNASCGDRNADGCLLLGRIYKTGLGKIKGIRTAFEAYKVGCELNSGESCFELGTLYYKENDQIIRDNESTINLYEKACKLKVANACYALGNIHRYRGSNYNIIDSFYDRACLISPGYCGYR